MSKTKTIDLTSGPWHFREWADRSMSHRPADAETMNRQGDMPLPLCDLHFYWEFYLLQYVSCLFIRCSAFLTSEMQKLIPLRNYIH